MSAVMCLFGLGCLVAGVLIGIAVTALLSANESATERAFNEGYARGYKAASMSVDPGPLELLKAQSARLRAGLPEGDATEQRGSMIPISQVPDLRAHLEAKLSQWQAARKEGVEP